MVMGGLNAKVERDWSNWMMMMMMMILGKFGYGEENDRGERLMNFCLSNNLMVMNTMFFQKKANRKWTWESPDSKTRNMIEI